MSTITSALPAFEQLILDVNDDLARITLNRPDSRNALSIQLSAELLEALRWVQASEDVRFLVIQGAGGTFCAGDDITEMPTFGNANQVMRRVRLYQEHANTLEELDKITIAAVEGYAVGGGLEITMACDFVIATQSAKWGMPEVDLGITPGWGGTTRMARLIGRRRTKEINLLGALQSAQRAVELDLWNRAVPDGNLQDEVDALLEVLRSKNQQAVRQLKFIINNGVEADLHTAQGFETLSATLIAALGGLNDIPDSDRAGIAAFAEKSEFWQRRRSLARNFWSK
ncbi:MAG: enoyl-CoA hydratase/isomerase family protein [Solirubrobacteraceae bacterium]